MTAVIERTDGAQAVWAASNQRWLSKRFAFWSEQLAREDADRVRRPPESSDGGDFQPAARQLSALFGLSAFETELIVLAAGVELDDTLRNAVARAQGVSPSDALSVSFSLALSLLPDPHWDALSPLGPLRHWSLIEFDTGPGLAQSLLRVDERIIHHLTGVAAFDVRLEGAAALDETASASTDHPVVMRIIRALVSGEVPLILLSDGMHDASRLRAGQQVAAAVLRHMGLRMLRIRAHGIGRDPAAIDSLTRRLDREAALASAGIVLTLDADAHVDIVGFVSALRSPVVILGGVTPMEAAEIRRPHVLRFSLGSPAPSSPRAADAAIDGAARRALRQFHVEPDVLEQVLASIADLDETAIESAVWNGLRDAARGGLDSLAQRIDSRATCDDLVLPPAAMAQLQQIARQLRHRDRVYDEWGFAERHSRGLGIAALFSGESGTGKTLAAEAIANEARLDLYRIDLSSVVSKYIGETEKNLARLFDAAERSGAVLLFDEADALFGKRSEVKDSHDRYANIEVAYLLQRIESYRGLAILTTNLKSALDRAFLRRIQFVVQFPFPGAAARTAIWNKVFPHRAPVHGLDVAQLGRLNLSGGSIRNVAVNAAFLAAAHGACIDMPTVIEAARAEYAKLERPADAALGEPS